MESDGTATFVIADVEVQYDDDSGRFVYKDHKCYFARAIAPNTFFCYERITLGANVNFQDFFGKICEMKGATLYVSAKAK